MERRYSNSGLRQKDVLMTIAVFLRSVVKGNFHATFWRAVEGATFSLTLINQVICVENLAVKNMVRNHSLAKAISDCGWGQFCTMLKYKAEWEGKKYLEIDRFFPSSKTCHVCLNKVDSLPLDIRNWICSKCNTSHDRDINAAKNIKDEGLRILSLLN